MLKSKKNLYVLIPVVLSIWGMVGYQIMDGLKPDLPVSEDFDYGSFRESETKTKAILTLQLPDTDPFLGTVAQKKRTQNKKKSNSSKKNPVEIPWPAVEYLGYVKQESRSGLRAVAMRINGNSYILKTGATQDSLKLVKATDDYIIMRYQKKDKKFKKQ
jgi:hypothetical protein